MSIKALRALATIAREGSFAAASEKLHLTQSAISVQIKALEQQLGFEIFDRSSRSPRLNADGRTVLKRAEDILSQYERLGDGLGPDSDFSFEFSIGAIRTAQYMLAPVLAKLLAQHPRLQLKVSRGLSSALAERVEQGELDAALIADPRGSGSALCDWSLYQEQPFYVVAPAGIVASDDEELLTHYPFIRFDRQAWAGRIIDEELKQRGLEPREVMELDSLEPALQMVEFGLGITVIPCGREDYKQLCGQYLLMPFGSPQRVRRMGVYQKKQHPRRQVTELVIAGLRARSASMEKG